MKNTDIILEYLRGELRARTLEKLSVKDGKSPYEIFQIKRMEELNENTLIIEDGILDSFGLVGLKAFVERSLDVHFDDSEVTVKTFATVKSIVELVDGKKS